MCIRRERQDRQADALFPPAGTGVRVKWLLLPEDNKTVDFTKGINSDNFMRTFYRYYLKGATYRIASTYTQTIISEIQKQRSLLEQYIIYHKDFLPALSPIPLLENPPMIARLMSDAAEKVGVGPMAAVAGTIAQMAVNAAVHAGAQEAIVENGGDIYLHSHEEVIIGIFSGTPKLSKALALKVSPEMMPCAVCSSSSTMGHSKSFGNCDLATIVSKNAALADAAATYAANLVKTPHDINATLDTIMAIQGVNGILLVKDDRIGLMGELPELVPHTDKAFDDKITKDKNCLL